MPTAVKVLEGNPGKRCLSGSEPKPQKKAPRCPSCLEDEAKKEWKRIVFDEAKAQRTVDFISCLKHTRGRWRGQNFELLPWQDSIIRDVFGTVKENGHRQYNTAYVEIPKKNGKSELAAGVALNMTCGDGEWGAEVYGCASDRHSVCFEQYQKAEDIILGRKIDHTFYPVIYGASDDAD